MSRTDSTEVVDALLREYMKRNDMSDALVSFDAENPRTEVSISNTSGIVRALALTRQYKANKARPPNLAYKSVLELLCGEAHGETQGEVQGKAEGDAEGTAEGDARGKAVPTPVTALTVDVEAAAAEFYERQRGATTSAPSPVQAQHSSLRSAATGAARSVVTTDAAGRVVTKSPNSGATPKREWGFNGAQPPNAIQELSPSSFGRQDTGPAGTPAPPAGPGGEMPAWATPGDANNVTMNSSNASKYSVGQYVGGLAGGSVCGWVVAVSLAQGVVEVATKPPVAAKGLSPQGLSPAVGAGYSSTTALSAGTPMPVRVPTAPTPVTPAPRVALPADDLLVEADDLLNDLLTADSGGGDVSGSDDDMYSFG